MSTKTVAIIGAGATGMTATKGCLEQGLEPTVFEKTNYSGGLWRYQSNLDENGIASVMKSTIINSSKEMSAFSDFPPPVDCPNYMHNTKMVGYFDEYAKRFDFLSYVRFRHELLEIRMADDYDLTGRWIVRVRKLDEGNEEVEQVFDGVMICTGHHGTVSIPTFKGQEDFKGKIIHTHSLKSGRDFEDQTVVVVGIGNSGGDAAVELSTLTKKCYLSTRRGTWVSKRVGMNGMPSDIGIHRRLISFLMRLLPYSIVCSFYEKELNQIFDHEEYQLKPKHRCFSQHVMINDSLPNRILSGDIQVKNDIDHFVKDGVVFKGESQVTPCDAVIMATGYKVTFPFLSQEILPVKENKIRLYKYQFIPHLRHPHTLAFISLIQPIGAILPIGELQSRWFSLLMTGKLSLPTRDQMERDIDRKLKANKVRYYESERHTIQVDWLPFMDELASEIGAKPPLLKYFFTDFRLFWNLMFAPAAAYQYRLVGPNSWKGAREAQLTVMDRIKGALKTKNAQQVKQSQCQSKCIIMRLLKTGFIGILIASAIFYSKEYLEL